MNCLERARKYARSPVMPPDHVPVIPPPPLFDYLPSLLDRGDIVEFYRMAGLFGLGDFSPEYGRFQVEEVSLE